MSPRPAVIAGVLGTAATGGVALALAIASPSGAGGVTPEAAQAAAAGPASAAAPTDQPPAVPEPPTEPHQGAEAEHGNHEHPEPGATTPPDELATHAQLVRDYFEVAFGFLPSDELGGYHQRANRLLHPDNPTAATGVLVVHVPHGQPGPSPVEVTEVTLAIDTGSRTAWNVTATVPGQQPTTTYVVVTDWLDEPRIHSHTANPDPVP